MKKSNDSEKTLKCISKTANTVMLFAIIYTLMVIISIFRRISMLKEISSTTVTFMSVAKEFWFSFIIIVLLVITMIAYKKKEKFGLVLELAIGFSMLLNVVISVIVVGFNIGALLSTLIIPFVILIHAFSVFMKIKKQKSV